MLHFLRLLKLNIKLAIKSSEIILHYILLSILLIVSNSVYIILMKNETIFYIYHYIWYAIDILAVSIFTIAVTNYFFFVQKKQGIHTIELRSGMKLWRSATIRLISSFIIISIWLIPFILIFCLVPLLIKNISEIQVGLIQSHMLFLWFYIIFLIPITVIIVQLFSFISGYFINFCLSFIIGIYPIILALTYSSLDRNLVDPSLLTSANLKLQIGNSFYNELFNDKNVKNIFNEDIFKTLKKDNKCDQKNSWDFSYNFNCSTSIEKQSFLFERSFMYGMTKLKYQTNSEQHEIKSIIDSNNTTIGKILFEIDKVSKNYNNYKDYNLYNYSWFLSDNNNELLYIDINTFINYLKDNLKEYKNLFSWIEELYDFIIYLTSPTKNSLNILTLFSSLQYPRNEDLFFYQIEGNNYLKLNSENKKVMEYYSNKPELLIINSLILQSYRYAMYIEPSLIDDILNIDWKNEEPDFISKLGYYEANYKHNNLIESLNITKNFLYLNRGIIGNKFVIEWFSLDYFQILKPLYYFNYNDLKTIYNNSLDNDLINQSIYQDINLKIKGGLNIGLMVFSWFIFDGLIYYISTIVYRKSTKF